VAAPPLWKYGARDANPRRVGPLQFFAQQVDMKDENPELLQEQFQATAAPPELAPAQAGERVTVTLDRGLAGKRFFP
jgi:hypothetical protein